MSIYDVVDIIEKYPEIQTILQGCPYNILKKFVIKSYEKDVVIFEQGNVYDCFSIVVEGKLNIYTVALNGKEYSQAIYERGNYIGELEIFKKLPFVSSVKSLSKVKLLVIDRESFLNWIKIDNNISNYLLMTNCELFYNLSEKASHDTLYSLKHRICEYLILKANNAKSIISINKDILSGQMAVTTRSINRVFQELKEKKIIEIRGNNVVILDLDKLKDEEKESRYL